ncbi:hypothetical protein JHK87_018711 [Glycine soja]|nr:hypothetical protein JHK87_018711 [Glycine soja]
MAIDLSNENAYIVHWAMQNYILSMMPASNSLFGTDWGFIDLCINTNPNSGKDDVSTINNNNNQKLEDDFNALMDPSKSNHVKRNILSSMSFLDSSIPRSSPSSSILAIPSFFVFSAFELQKKKQFPKYS